MRRSFGQEQTYKEKEEGEKEEEGEDFWKNGFEVRNHESDQYNSAEFRPSLAESFESNRLTCMCVCSTRYALMFSDVKPIF